MVSCGDWFALMVKDTTQWVYLFSAYGKIGTNRDKTLHFSAFTSFLMNSTIREN
jgi:hypothetical protein